MPQLKITDVSQPHYGFLKVVFNQPFLEKIRLLETPDSLAFVSFFEKDTLHFWYENNQLDSLSFIVSDGGVFRDTIKIKEKNKENYFKNKPNFSTKLAATTFDQNPDKPLFVSFQQPIKTVFQTKIRFLEDGISKEIVPTVDTKNPRLLTFSHKWQEGKKYQIVLLEGALSTIHNVLNDSLTLNFKVIERKTLGNVTATAEGLKPEKAYIVQLLTQNNDVIDEFYSQGKTTATHRFLSVLPADYKLRVIEDTNENRYWDTGNYPFSQPESVFLSPTATNLRANWELDLKIILN
jgi:hypothetical protein